MGSTCKVATMVGTTAIYSISLIFFTSWFVSRYFVTEISLDNTQPQFMRDTDS